MQKLNQMQNYSLVFNVFDLDHFLIFFCYKFYFLVQAYILNYLRCVKIACCSNKICIAYYIFVCLLLTYLLIVSNLFHKII